MTIDEKLSHFYDVTVEEARSEAAAALEEHKKHLEKMLEQHKAASMENASAQIKAETASVKREVNKALSAQQLSIKRDWTQKQNELKEKLFAEVRQHLEDFKTTDAYKDYLCDKIKEAVEFAGDDEVFLYLAPEDAGLLTEISAKSGCTLQVSEEDFLGGIKATIPQKNILIDHSFAGNYNSVYKEFKFDGGPKHE